MTDDNTPQSRKKLSLSGAPRKADEHDEKPKVRSGARARAVAQSQLRSGQGKTTPAKSGRPLPTDRAAARSDRTAQTHEPRRTASDHTDRPMRTERPRPAAGNRDFNPGAPLTRKRPQARTDDRATRAQHESEQARPRPSSRLTETFRVFAPCPQGLEEVLCEEMQALGFEHVEKGRAGCAFETDWAGILRANLYSRLATRILVQVAHGLVLKEDDIYELAYDAPWERWFGAEHSLRVDTSAIQSPMKSLMFCNLKAKDGICDRLRDREGERPSIDTVRPDARVHLFLTRDSGTLYLDTSGESLFKRGWRLDKGEAPLRENLAAGILALSGWDPSLPLLDPFCGSGTILIEAAWIAQGVPPGISRPFGFERLRNADARQWTALKEDALSRIAPELETPLYGCDLNPHALEAARENMQRANLAPDSIQFARANALDLQPPTNAGWLVTNPPYGERMDEQDDGFWRDWSACLKQQFAGWQVHVISSDLELPGKLRLKARRRTPLYNGALDCRLFSFEMVAESYRKP
ncbi:THUMP domain-containing class I SAM-dependent RNA methyltransferase [Advenella incenata]|jgi:putative N6-adenine-specific DNA methylase